MLRMYDAAFIAKLNAVVQGGDTKMTVAAPGIVARVPVYLGLPEEWFATYALPGISISRKDLLPDPSRALPAYRQQYTENGYVYTQQAAPQPVNIIYLVELAAESMTEMNGLAEYCLAQLPFSGYGTVMTVDTQQVSFRGTDVRDKTQMVTKRGRLFLYQYTYIVEGWLVQVAAADSVKQILTVDTDLELHTSAPPLPTATPADAESILHLVNR